VNYISIFDKVVPALTLAIPGAVKE